MKEAKLYFKLCPNCSFFCGSEEPDKYCSSCGNELITKCPTCSKDITNPYAKFCKYCGTAYPGKLGATNKYINQRS